MKEYDDNFRYELLPYIGKILRFTGRLVTTSQDGFQGKTYLLKNINNKENNIVIEHCWVSDGKEIKNTNLNIGDIIEFDSKCNTYTKSGNKINISLSSPKNINIL